MITELGEFFLAVHLLHCPSVDRGVGGNPVHCDHLQKIGGRSVRACAPADKSTGQLVQRCPLSKVSIRHSFAICRGVQGHSADQFPIIHCVDVTCMHAWRAIKGMGCTLNNIIVVFTSFKLQCHVYQNVCWASRISDFWLFCKPSVLVR